MDAALHGYHMLFAHFTEHKLPFVTTYCGNRKERNRIIGNDYRITDLLDKLIAQAGAKYNANLCTNLVTLKIARSF